VTASRSWPYQWADILGGKPLGFLNREKILLCGPFCNSFNLFRIFKIRRPHPNWNVKQKMALTHKFSNFFQQIFMQFSNRKLLRKNSSFQSTPFFLPNPFIPPAGEIFLSK